METRTFGTGGWLVEPNSEKLLKLSRISFATCGDQQVAYICANLHDGCNPKAIKCSVEEGTGVTGNDLDDVVDEVSPHVTEVVESLLGNLPIIRIRFVKRERCLC